MTAEPNAFLDAIVDRDPAAIRAEMSGAEFVLISMSDAESEEGEESGALTAEIDGHDALVVFTSEELAAKFVKDQADLFEADEEVEGLVVEGDALLEYLPDGFGMLFDPEVEEAAMIDPELAASIAAI